MRTGPGPGRGRHLRTTFIRWTPGGSGRVARTPTVARMQTTSPVPARARRASVALVGLAAAAITPVALAAPDHTGPAATSSSSTPALDLGPADLTETRRTTTLQPGRHADPDRPRRPATRACSGPTRSRSPRPTPRRTRTPRRARSRTGPAPRPRPTASRARASPPGSRRSASPRPPTSRRASSATASGSAATRPRPRRTPARPAWRRPGRPRAASTPAGTATPRTADRGTSTCCGSTPGPFDGRLAGSFGPDLYHRETTSQLAAAGGATAAVNAGFFVLDPASGAPGDPAGAGVYDGRVLSEATDGRPALVLHDDARGSAVRRLTWGGGARIAGKAAAARRRRPGAGPDPQLRRRHAPTRPPTCRCTTSPAPTTASWWRSRPSTARSTPAGRRAARWCSSTAW